MKVTATLPLQDRHAAMFTTEQLEQFARDVVGKPVTFNPTGTDPQQTLGRVESAVVEGDRVHATLDVELPPAMADLFAEGDLAYGANITVKRKRGVPKLDEFIRANSVDAVRPPFPPR